MKGRAAYAKVRERNLPLLQRILEIKADHPFWGYRRVWAFLRFIDGLVVNQKRVYRIMQLSGLTVKSNFRLKAKRTFSKSKPRADKPNQWWGIDMTKVLVNAFGWVYIVVVLDWYTKKIVGHYIGLRSKSEHWLMALDMAVNRQFPSGVRDAKGEVHLMSDNGCQPTSKAFMRAASQMDIKQAFTSYNNPRGNADTERMMRTLKEELFWLREWQSPFQIERAFNNWVASYNATYLHSTLGRKSPENFEKAYNLSHETPKVAA